MWQYTTWNGAVWRWDEAGFYERLVGVPPQACRPREEGQDPRKVERYAALYRAGSPFPPIGVLSPIPEEPFYAIIDGHHRWRAALEVEKRGRKLKNRATDRASGRAAGQASRGKRATRTGWQRRAGGAARSGGTAGIRRRPPQTRFHPPLPSRG